jgi:hypothetical protein
VRAWSAPGRNGDCRGVRNAFTCLADAAGMDLDLFADSACAASDLTARFLSELANADARLAIAEASLQAAASNGATIPKIVRVEHRARRRQVIMLRQVLAGMPAVA